MRILERHRLPIGTALFCFIYSCAPNENTSGDLTGVTGTRDDPIIVSQEEANAHRLEPHETVIHMNGVNEISGEISLPILVSPKGNVIETSWNSEEIDGPVRLPVRFLASRMALRDWKYRPFMKDGEPVFAAFNEIVTVIALVANPRPDEYVPFPEIQDWQSLRMTLRRESGGLVARPAYSVEVHGDGTVLYTGTYNVPITGEIREHISQDAVRALFAEFMKIEYFWLFDRYVESITDQATYRTSISFDGHTKYLENYSGGSVGMPAEVYDLERRIDEIAGTDKWVSITDETMPWLSRPEQSYLFEDGRPILADMYLEGAGRQTLRELIVLGADVNAPTEYNFGYGGLASPLAVAAGNPEVVALLVEAGADTTDMLQINAALGRAAQFGNAESVELFLGLGADPNSVSNRGMTPLMYAAESLYSDTASENSYLDTVGALLTAGADIAAQDERGDTALIYAVDGISVAGSIPANAPQVIRALLDAGASDQINTCFSAGRTAIGTARALPIVQLLYAAGADPNLRCNGRRPLETARAEIIPFLIEIGADPYLPTLTAGSIILEKTCEREDDRRCLALRRALALR